MRQLIPDPQMKYQFWKYCFGDIYDMSPNTTELQKTKKDKN